MERLKMYVELYNRFNEDETLALVEMYSTKYLHQLDEEYDQEQWWEWMVMEDMKELLPSYLR